jgi:hypothetical protein
VINPYQAPTTAGHSDADQRRVWIALVPFFIAAVAIVAEMGALFGRQFAKEVGVAFGIIGALLVFDLPVCVYVLVKWVRAGVPPDLVAELMEITPEQRDFHRKLRKRPKLDETVFYQSFYERSDVPKHMIVYLRQLLEDVSGCDLAGLHPGDNLAYIDSEMDFADVLNRIERDLIVKLDWDQFRDTEVTFDSLLRAVLRRMATTSSGGPILESSTDA